MKCLVFALVSLLTLCAVSADDPAALDARLKKINVRLGTIEKSKNRIYIEQHNLEIGRLREEKEEIEAKLARDRQSRERDEFERKSEALKAELDRQWATNSVIDVSHVPNVPGLPSNVEAVRLVEKTPVWVAGSGKAYKENGVVVVDGGERQSLWIVQKDYDAEGRLMKVTPICRYAMPEK